MGLGVGVGVGVGVGIGVGVGVGSGSCIGAGGEEPIAIRAYTVKCSILAVTMHVVVSTVLASAVYSEPSQYAMYSSVSIAPGGSCSGS